MKQDHTRAPLFEAVMGYIDKNPGVFHMPGHRMGAFIDRDWAEFAGRNVFRMDLSEVHGLGNIYSHAGPIRDAEKLAEDAWGAGRTFFLVGGTSAGIVSAIATAVHRGENIIVPRNAHVSVIHGLVMSGAVPVYAMPDWDTGFTLAVSPETIEKCIETHPEAKAVLVTSPTYYGIVSDIESIAEIAHKHGMILIVDEAHGSHLYFHEGVPKGALVCGADIVCSSVHKTSGSLTQSSMLHIGKDAMERVDMNLLKSNLRLTQSTSPSYLLMVSLDLARRSMVMHGKERIELLTHCAKLAAERIENIPGVDVLSEILSSKSVAATRTVTDPLRIVISARELKMPGFELYDLLSEKYHIEAEFADHACVVFLLGIGTDPNDLKKLTDSLAEIASSGYGLGQTPDRVHNDTGAEESAAFYPALPPAALSPNEAWFAPKEDVPLGETEGRICAETIMAYPPGIPALCPGDVVTEAVIRHLEFLRNSNARIVGSFEDLSKITVVK